MSRPRSARRSRRSLAALIGEDSPAYRLTRSQVRELARQGFEIGFHTRDHRPLPELADAELAAALRDGRAALEAATERPLKTIAYPHGRADDRASPPAARAAGFTDGFGGLDRAVTPDFDRLLLGRAELLLDDPSTFALALAAELRAQR